MEKIKYLDFELFYKGDLSLLQKPKIAIVGSRKATKYSRDMTKLLAKKLSSKFTIVSGGALGIDTHAHQGAYPNTIMVSPSSLDIFYPKTNETLIKDMQKNALVISEYEKKYLPRKYSFVQRNRIIVAISDFLIIAEAEKNSGSMRSFEWAQQYGKKVFVLPHRLNESSGTRYLAATNQAEVIWDIDEFCDNLGVNSDEKILTLNEALKKYGSILYEMELEGKVEIKNGKVYFNG
ncbi:DNA-processing protein DprA [Caminibacter pacificus]